MGTENHRLSLCLTWLVVFFSILAHPPLLGSLSSHNDTSFAPLSFFAVFTAPFNFPFHPGAAGVMEMCRHCREFREGSVHSGSLGDKTVSSPLPATPVVMIESGMGEGEKRCFSFCDCCCLKLTWRCSTWRVVNYSAGLLQA